MSIITAFLAKYAIESLAVAIGGPIIAWILAKIPTGRFSKWITGKGQDHGKAVSKFCRKKIPFWERAFEPFFVDNINAIAGYFAGFIVGLKADNK